MKLWPDCDTKCGIEELETAVENSALTHHNVRLAFSIDGVVVHHANDGDAQITADAERDAEPQT